MSNPRCLYCDTPRPPSEARCPQCGHPWIDATIAEAIAPPVKPDGADVIEVPVSGVEIQGVGRRRWVFPVAITAGAVAVYAIVFAVLLDRTGRDPEPSPPDAAPSTVASDPPVTSIQQPATTPTSPPETTLAPTTTRPPTTTTTTTTEPPIPALGDPIALEDLTLGAFSLGPLDFGDTDISALGRLVATFGQPDEVSTIGEAEGLCPTESGRSARFGWLTVLVRDEAGTDVLVGYRLEEPAEAVPGHPTADLRTISGAGIGDTETEWNAIYRTSIVRRTEIEGMPMLLLLRSSDERTLLWGPLSQDEPAAMLGIYSPRPCDGGPFG